MAAFWRWIVAVLTWLSAEPQAIDREAPKAAAAVAIAYAALATEAPSPPPPAPTPPAPGGPCACGCKDGIWKPDGRITEECPCPKTCRCKTKTQACPDGKCPPTS